MYPDRVGGAYIVRRNFEVPCHRMDLRPKREPHMELHRLAAMHSGGASIININE